MGGRYRLSGVLRTESGKSYRSDDGQYYSITRLKLGQLIWSVTRKAEQNSDYSAGYSIGSLQGRKQIKLSQNIESISELQ
jgi:hypothetical protein